LKKMTFEMASCILLGSEPGEENDRLFQWFGTLSQGLFSPTTSWQWTPYGKALHAREQILAYIDRAIAKRQITPTQDVLSLLMQTKDEAGEGLSLEEIKSQALSLLIGTNANTASMLVCFCMALAQNPEVLQLARSEQQGIAQEGTLSLEQIKGMTYLNQVLQEVERLYPPVGAGFRSTIVPFEFQGYCVPVGWNVMYSIIGTHMDADIYPEPLRFDPDRFSADRAEHKKQEFSLIGFGGGARSCLGFAFAQTLVKVFAALLVRGYDWEMVAGQDLRLDRIPTASPRSGLQVRFLSLKM
jgi:retinoid hydroxylase